MTAVLSRPAAAPTAKRPSLARHHDFRLLWIGESTSSLGSSVTGVALPLVALGTLHAGVVAVSLLSAAAWLPWLLVGLPAGAWVDRLRRRPVMIVCDVASLLLFASVPAAAGLGLLTMAQLLVVALLTGTAKVFFSTAYRTLLPALLEPADRVRGNAALQGAESATQVVGPGLGGVLAQLFGAANGLLADAVSFLVSLACLLRLRLREAPIVRERRSLGSEIGEGLRFVLRDRLLRAMMLFGAAANLTLTAFGAIQLTFLVRELGVRPATAGLLVAAGSVGGVAGALAAPVLARRLGSARALLLGKVAALPLTLLIPLAADGWRLTYYVVGMLALVTGVVAGNVISAGFLPGYCPPQMLARVSSCSSVVNFGSIPIGAVLGGVLAESLGFRPALWLIFAGLLASSGVLLASPMRGLRDLPTRTPEPS